MILDSQGFNIYLHIYIKWAKVIVDFCLVPIQHLDLDKVFVVD
jgi:hypothetical protein